MKKIVMATTNLNKVKRIRALLKDLNYEVVSLKEYEELNIGEPEETADNPVGIAMEKAIYYANKLPEDTIILTQDDTMELIGIEEEDNPGMHIKGPILKKYGKFTDQLGAEYYKNLASKYGGFITTIFKYGHALAIKNKGERHITKVIGAESKLEVRIVDSIYKLNKCPGYFLSSLMEAKVDDKWKKYQDLDDEKLIKLDSDLYKSINLLLRNID